MKRELETGLILGVCNLDTVARTVISNLAQQSLDEGKLLPHAERLSKLGLPLKHKNTKRFLGKLGVNNFWLVLPGQLLLERLKSNQEGTIFCQIHANLKYGLEREWTFSVVGSYPSYSLFSD